MILFIGCVHLSAAVLSFAISPLQVCFYGSRVYTRSQDSSCRDGKEVDAEKGKVEIYIGLGSLDDSTSVSFFLFGSTHSLRRLLLSNLLLPIAQCMRDPYVCP